MSVSVNGIVCTVEYMEQIFSDVAEKKCDKCDK